MALLHRSQDEVSDSVGTSGVSGLPFAVHVAVKLLPYGTFGVYLLLSTFLDSGTIVLIQYGQSTASISM